MTIVEELDGTPEMDAELPLFNKIGDLYVKLNKGAEAADMYEKAVKRYIETGLDNNAIALCNKILRTAPGRTHIYLKLAQLMVQRGLLAEAKQHFVEYADRMQKAGRTNEAFKALKELADLTPNNEALRLMLAEQLKLAARGDEAQEQLAKTYAEAQGTGRARQTLTKIKAIDPNFDESKGPKEPVKKGKSSDLVFLDLDAPPEPAPAKAGAKVSAPPPPPPPKVEAPPPPPPKVEAPPPPPPKAEAPPPPPPEPEPEIQRAEVEFTPPAMDLEPTSLGLEPTSLAEEPAAPEPEPVIEPPAMESTDLSLEPTSLDLGEPATLELEPSPSLDLSLDMAPTEEPVVLGPPDVPTLETRIQEDPNDVDAHQALAEALLEQGQRDRGLSELDAALTAAEGKEDWQKALDLTEEIVRIDANSVKHHQKRVEYAFRTGEKPRLVDAYLELSDALFRSGAMERAQAVYKRVIELDPGNARAMAALASFEPPPAPAPAAAPAKGKSGKAAAPAAPAATGAAAGDFVDLNAMMMEDDEPKDTRMRVQDEEPTGDEQRDFDDMLSQFKKGIAETIAVDDSQAHYDLGVAFKEMGLIDEAIGEFQKALRGVEYRLRTSEALGTCFFEKGQYSVAATVLKRALDGDQAGDENKIGLLYWLGRCEEEQGNGKEALGYYHRVFSVDIQFQDVQDRVKDLSKK